MSFTHSRTRRKITADREREAQANSLCYERGSLLGSLNHFKIVQTLVCNSSQLGCYATPSTIKTGSDTFTLTAENER